MRIWLYLGFLVLTMLAWGASEPSAIEKRIRPVGQVSVEGEAPTVAIPSSPEKPGKKIYETYCVVCHQAGLANAPKFRTHDWTARLKTKTLDGLAASAMQGINAMPIRGTCPRCSKADLKEAIEYMLPE